MRKIKLEQEEEKLRILRNQAEMSELDLFEKRAKIALLEQTTANQEEGARALRAITELRKFKLQNLREDQEKTNYLVELVVIRMFFSCRTIHYFFWL